MWPFNRNKRKQRRNYAGAQQAASLATGVQGAGADGEVKNSLRILRNVRGRLCVILTLPSPHCVLSKQPWAGH